MNSATIAYRVTWADRAGRVKDSVIRQPNAMAVQRSIERRRGTLLVILGPFLSGRGSK